jgi:hypothetical protein
MKPTLFALISLLMLAPSAQGAALRISPSEIRPGEAADIAVMLDTEGETINALEGELEIPEALGSSGLGDGGSIVSFWLENPALVNGRIRFSGLIPGGYSGERGLLFKVRVLPEGEGSFPLGLSQVKYYLNDGAGSEARSTGTAPVLGVTKEAPMSLMSEDREPPESFVPELARTEGEFEGKWFLAFATTDKGSGMDHYEVMEVAGAHFWSRTPSAWTVARSPYVLEDQSLRSEIYIRAVDKAGNFRIVSIPARPRSNQQRLYVALVLGLVCLMVMRRAYRAYRTWRSAS